MIGIFLGFQNSGKTLAMTYYAYTYYKKGYDIYSNYNLKFSKLKNDKRLHKLTMDKIIECVKNREQFNKAIFLIDEMYLFMDSRNFGSKKQKIMTYFLLQTSKRNVHLFGTAQVFNSVEKRFRENCNFMVFCSRVIKNENEYLNVFDNMRFLIDSENLYIKNVFLIKRSIESLTEYYDKKIFYLKAKNVFNLYDTTELINILED